ncbi:hypothetical protein CFI00_14765 [Nocardioides sp. S5]|uniref:hypothetical protein n=1 Tax=Nocardioides sp. S5 TaxID=2017486 RepID=UPI001A8CB9B2|nr:hypothetical protein [Nocardioides sp. S5]QSR31744.1 hypothetical protein CFI00_14765 [Nocardioides sp. S5]
MSEPGDPYEVGSLGEEAAKLFGALSGWAREHVGDAGEGLSGFAAHAAATVHDLDDHLSTGSAKCTVCPLCRTVHAVRRLSPEVKGHLSGAAESLAHAAAAFMATVENQQPSAADVQHIDLDDDWPADG